MSSRSTVELYESDTPGEWSVHIFKEVLKQGQLWVSIETKNGTYIDVPLEAMYDYQQ